MDNLYLILIGMMGSGKSAIGRRIAADLGLPFVDTDTLLQNRFGRPVHEIFAMYGEEAFRGHETSILKSLEPQRGILSTGGGIVLREENWQQLRRLGSTAFLEVPVPLLLDRLARSQKKRPLLMVENWEDRLREIYESRLPLYLRSDFRIRIEDESIERAAQRVIQQVGLAQS